MPLNIPSPNGTILTLPDFHEIPLDQQMYLRNLEARDERLKRLAELDKHTVIGRKRPPEPVQLDMLPLMDPCYYRPRA